MLRYSPDRDVSPWPDRVYPLRPISTGSVVPSDSPSVSPTDVHSGAQRKPNAKIGLRADRYLLKQLGPDYPCIALAAGQEGLPNIVWSPGGLAMTTAEPHSSSEKSDPSNVPNAVSPGDSHLIQVPHRKSRPAAQQDRKRPSSSPSPRRESKASKRSSPSPRSHNRHRSRTASNDSAVMSLGDIPGPVNRDDQAVGPSEQKEKQFNAAQGLLSLKKQDTSIHNIADHRMTAASPADPSVDPAPPQLPRLSTLIEGSVETPSIGPSPTEQKQNLPGIKNLIESSDRQMTSRDTSNSARSSISGSISTASPQRLATMDASTSRRISVLQGQDLPTSVPMQSMQSHRTPSAPSHSTSSGSPSVMSYTSSARSDPLQSGMPGPTQFHNLSLTHPNSSGSNTQMNTPGSTTSFDHPATFHHNTTHAPSPHDASVAYASLSPAGHDPNHPSPSQPVHLPTQQYVCTFPGCTAPPFQTPYLLNSHNNVHSNVRPHFCPEPGCPRSEGGVRGEGGRGFKRKNEAIRHRLVHVPPVYVCPFCPADQERKYPRPDNLQRHLRNQHTDHDPADPRLKEILSRRPGHDTSPPHASAPQVHASTSASAATAGLGGNGGEGFARIAVRGGDAVGAGGAGGGPAIAPAPAPAGMGMAGLGRGGNGVGAGAAGAGAHGEISVRGRRRRL